MSQVIPDRNQGRTQMKNIPLIISTALFLMLAAPLAFANPIPPNNRACVQDSDCAIITTACICMICNDDAPVDAVNKQFADAFDFQKSAASSERAACTNYCSTAGACAMRKTPTAVCTNHQCTLTWSPFMFK